jgi:hypothetical protein
MKKLSLICIGLLFTAFGFSQSYEITSLGSQYSAAEIDAAFVTANLCNSSFKTKDREITLDDGAILSFKANSSCGNEDSHVYEPVTFSINGTTLLIGHTYIPSYSKKEQQQNKATKQ